jgi:hypothetical protein
MISLTCTKCKTTLEMDDAFAGGVCRCQHCGTIQTVPSRLKQSGRPSSPVGTGQKALYGGTGHTSGSGAIPSSGLDDLATAVAGSSGLSNNLTTPRSTRTSVDRGPSSPAKPASRMPLYLAIGGCAVLAIVVVILLATRGGSTPPANPSPNNTPAQQTGGKTPSGQAPPVTGGNPPAPSGIDIPAGPHFQSLPLKGKKVVYVLDRGSSSTSVFDPLKAVVIDSVASLGSSAQFQVLFWTPGGPNDNPNEFAYPKRKLVSASSSEVDALRREIEDLSTGTATDITSALTEAMKRNPDMIIIATAKGGINLDDAFAQQVKKIRGTKKMPIHTIDLTDSGDGEAVLSKVARDTGGTYVHIRPADLRVK